MAADPTSSPSSRAQRQVRGIGARVPRQGKAWLLGTFALALVVWAGNWVFHRYTHLYIDDARIDGEVVTLSSRVSGWITDLPVIEGDHVKKGQVLAHIDDRDAKLQREVLLSRLQTFEGQMAVLRAQTGQVDQETLGKVSSETNRLAAAEAEAAALEVQAKLARDDYRRAQGVKEFISEQEIERARGAAQLAEAAKHKASAEVAAVRGTLSTAGGSRRQVQVIERQLAVLMHQAGEIRAEIKRQDADIADRNILSPADGLVVMTFVRKGEHVSAGQRIAMFHDPTRIWVEAKVKETDIGALRPGMPVDIHVDAYPGKIFRGEIHRIGQAATNKFALLPDPNPSGNFTKITQRLPVRITLTDKDRALRPGMTVEVGIDIRQH